VLAHVQQFAVASTTETTTTFVGRADVERHIMRADTIVKQATAKEITHEDVEMVRRFGAAFLTVVFGLPLSDVTVVGGERAVFECRVAMPRRHEFTWCVENVEIRQTGDEELGAADWSKRVGGTSERRRPRAVGFLCGTDRRARPTSTFRRPTDSSTSVTSSRVTWLTGRSATGFRLRPACCAVGWGWLP